MYEKLADISSIGPGLAGVRRMRSVPKGMGVPVISMADDTPDGLRDPEELACVIPRGPMARYSVEEGDVLFRTRGDRATAIAVDARFFEPVIALLPFFILRPDETRVVHSYLAWAINQPPVQRQLARSARGTGTQMILRPVLENLRIALPPLATQRRIAATDAAAKREYRLRVKAAEMRRSLASTLLREVVWTSNQGRT